MGMVCGMKEYLAWVGKTTYPDPNGGVKTKISKYGKGG